MDYCSCLNNITLKVFHYMHYYHNLEGIHRDIDREIERVCVCVCALIILLKIYILQNIKDFDL